jgi:putative flavoprotein involved in K+ transport
MQALPTQVDAVVVGAGQAGLATSHYLSAFGIEHVVVERERVGESWRSGGVGTPSAWSLPIG